MFYLVEQLETFPPKNPILLSFNCESILGSLPFLFVLLMVSSIITEVAFLNLVVLNNSFYANPNYHRHYLAVEKFSKCFSNDIIKNGS